MSMSLQLFSDIQSIRIEIQSYHSYHSYHAPIVTSYDQQYHNDTVNKNCIKSNNHTNIDEQYFVSSISFDESHSKFRFAVKKSFL